jgi:hypothetical protein
VSAAKRQDLRALIEDPPEPPPAPALPTPPPAATPAEPAEPAAPRTMHTARREPAAAVPDAQSEQARPRPRPRKGRRRPASELVTPARQAVPREALKADVPTELDLVRRLHLYRLDHGLDIRDQVAIAVDQWLESQGY